MEWGGLKEVDRVLEKLVRSYERDPARILDYCRQACSVRACPDPCRQAFVHDICSQNRAWSVHSKLCEQCRQTSCRAIHPKASTHRAGIEETGEREAA